MDEELIFWFFVSLFFVSVFTLPLSITACVAASATRRWAKDKSKAKARFYSATDADAESNPLVEESDSEAEDEIEYLDSEDEEYHLAKREQKLMAREAKEAELLLSTQAKFLKEWKQCWTGPTRTEQQRMKERELKEEEDRRKLAREAVREYLRMERKKASKAQKQEQAQEEVSAGLPTYGNAVGEKAKE
ncbi:uncharacterized protein A1O9_02178 [Exophiala aquamarina CBS 119918]|uniref:Uncharacterized protein n=1 Tax=Exophiala aquamarina CBS 119918 TaxID=1182545 RepID=A0A072PLI5_9EURO|nr:uncharacterized protein A1O9_02178 [Exophiala aquamarina CBS 119918]KEF60617.1 hypothetical protein A1O9_02178 [Exophiala aquamarina CBS 119918]